MSYHTTALTSPPVTAWTPSSFHLLASQRAGCSTTFVTKNPTFNRISWPIQEWSYPFLKEFMFNFILDVFSFHICFRGSRILRFYLPIFRIGFRLRRTVAAQRLQRYILLPRSPGANSDEPPHGFTLRREPSSLSRIACRPPNLALGKFRWADFSLLFHRLISNAPF